MNVYKLKTDLHIWEVQEILDKATVSTGNKTPSGKDILKHFDFELEHDNELERELSEAVGRLVNRELDKFKSSLRSL